MCTLTADNALINRCDEKKLVGHFDGDHTNFL